MKKLIKKILKEDQNIKDFDWIREPHLASKDDILHLIREHSMYSYGYKDVISELHKVGLTDAQMTILVESLDYVYEHGMDEGRDEGYDDGHDDGRSEGYDEGWDEGYEEGEREGHNHAMDECEEKLEDKWNEGYQQGTEDCEENISE
jgi:hypothetical protein